MAIKMKGGEATPAIEPALAINYRKVADLTAYENNPRKNDSEVPKMVELIEQFGFKVPVLVRGDRIVDGHLRIKAAKKMGLEEVPTIDVGDMAEPEERALRIALNKSVEWAKWDKDLLGKEMKAIMDGGLDLKFTGFDGSEVNDLIKKVAKDNPGIPGDVPPKVTKTKDADAGTPADPNYISLSFHMTAENRTAVLMALEEYRVAHSLVNPSQALIAMAKEWKAQQSE